jgi:hypothetical protein
MLTVPTRVQSIMIPPRAFKLASSFTGFTVDNATRWAIYLVFKLEVQFEDVSSNGIYLSRPSASSIGISETQTQDPMRMKMMPRMSRLQIFDMKVLFREHCEKFE